MTAPGWAEEQIAGGWIAHDGGSCPVAHNLYVQVYVRGGRDRSGGPSGYAPAGVFLWDHKVRRRARHIIAYRKELPDAR